MQQPPPPDQTKAHVSESLLELLRETGSSSSNVIDQILDTTGIDGNYGGVDGRETLIGIMQCLLTLCGSEEAAVDWLFRAQAYREITGSYPDLALENGNFWSLSVLEDWLQIIVRHRHTCPELMAEIFKQ